MTEPGDSILTHLEYIRAAVDAVNARLDIINGRVRTTEIDIAVLRDRASEARNSGAKWGAGVGAGVAGAVAGLWQFFGGGGR